jgi:Fe-Mn family superoxide dismutase
LLVFQINRRSFLTGAAAVSAVAALPRCSSAQAPGPFKLDPLPYAYNALEPYIDKRTMELHHDLHHGSAVNALNAAIKDHPEVARMRLEVMLFKLGELPEEIRTAVRNNGGSHANHTMFWQIMGKGGGQPDANLKAAFDRDFGGFDKFQATFSSDATKLFGAGWVFVTVDGDGLLKIASKPNQDTPLMEGQRALMGIDVWEHAYYLNYQNRRADYIKAWWNVINWQKVSQRYASALDGDLGI